MIVTYQYQINPTPDLISLMDNWLELWLRHWNYALGQGLDWLHRTRCQIDRCSTLSEPIAQIPTLVNYYTQQTALKENIFFLITKIFILKFNKSIFND